MVGVRSILRQCHLWLGLSLGALFLVIGVTGSALVFYVEIDAMIHPEAQSNASLAAPNWDSPLWDRILATGRAHYPDTHGDWSFEVSGKGGAIPARYYPSAHHQGHHAEREMLWFSADGSKILRSQPWGGYAMSWLYELHMHLLAGEAGRVIVGWSGFGVLVLLVSGVWLWWPRGSWRKALAFKKGAVPIRRWRDIHKLAGLWGFAALFLLAGTGALLALPDMKTRLLTAVIAAPDTLSPPRSTASSGRQVPISVALAAGHKVMPDARLAFIDIPHGGDQAIRLRVQVPGDPHDRFPASFIYIDQYSGRVLAVQDLRNGHGADAVNSWIRPIHDGSVGGLLGRLLAVIFGFVPLLLFISGLLHWRRRRTARNAYKSTERLS